ncbi:MAG TPA: hypothetical protein VF040_09410 [Ktedonobacterales bacterium]
MENGIPRAFGADFLDWFRARTEATWSTCPVPTLERFEERRVFGCDWQPGTRWLGGLAEEQMAAVEHNWALRFPPDYRLFLKHLHAVDRPMKCREGRKAASDLPTLRDAPSFYNWLTEGAIVRERLDDLVMGLEFDVEEAGLWRPTWGTRPATAEARAKRVRALVEAAPRLIPVFGHRYLLAEPCRLGNPVFSIVQSDLIIYGADLRTYFLAECADLLGIDRDEIRKQMAEVIQVGFATHAAIPFWGDLYAG